ncbi:cytochrome b5-like heme/steroid binding domain-containing protein [Amylostereum chailletii]|nr:cytochrome b5-like heme/steroid binding domain-containing protein [Amylostereum chailletii]
MRPFDLFDFESILRLLVFPAAYFLQNYLSPNPDPPSRDSEPEPAQSQEETKSIMQAERTDLAPPKDDPFTLEQLKQFDGVDESKPIYVAIKGTVFDVSHKQDTYGPGKSYNLFAGKDASKGLGMSSLKTEDAVPDYSGLPENERKVLDDWHSFFTKRYNIVGRVVDLPPAVANL